MTCVAAQALGEGADAGDEMEAAPMPAEHAARPTASRRQYTARAPTGTFIR